MARRKSYDAENRHTEIIIIVIEFEFKLRNNRVGPHEVAGTVQMRQAGVGEHLWRAKCYDDGTLHKADDAVGAALIAIGAKYGLEVTIK